MVEKVVPAILLADEATAALVGDRVRPVTQAQFAALPFVTFRVSDYEQIRTQVGASGFAKTTLAVDAWALSYQEATQLQTKIRTALQFKKGTFGEVNVRNITPQGKAELHEQSGDGTDRPLYAVSADYVILHTE